MGHKQEDGSWKDECLEKLNHGEPFFVLRAQDKLSALVVRIWCLLAEAAGTPDSKLARAFITARAMDEWENQKTPD